MGLIRGSLIPPLMICARTRRTSSLIFLFFTLFFLIIYVISFFADLFLSCFWRFFIALMRYSIPLMRQRGVYLF